MNITVTLIIQIIAFAIFVILINKLLYKPLSGIMSARQKRIEEGLIVAQRAQVEQKEAEEAAKTMLDKSKSQASEIITNAQKQANDLISEAKEAALVEADNIKASASDDMKRELSRVKNDLQSQVGDLVMLGVGKVLDKEVDKKTHQKTLDELTTSLS